MIVILLSVTRPAETLDFCTGKGPQLAMVLQLPMHWSKPQIKLVRHRRIQRGLRIL